MTESLVQRREPLAVVLFVRMGEFLLERAQGRIAIDYIFDCRLSACGDILRHMGDGEPPGQFEIARLLVQLAE